MTPVYELLPDRSGVIAYGSTLPELFEHAAFGLFDTVFAIDQLKANRDVPIAIAGDSFEELLVNWLEELLRIAEAEQLALGVFTVDWVEEGGLRGAVAGDPNHRPPRRWLAIEPGEVAIVEVPDGFWARFRFTDRPLRAV